MSTITNLDHPRLTFYTQTTLGIWQWVANHDPSNFLYPDSFIPDRWLNDRRFDNDNKDVFQPFSYGPRNCIGMK